MSMEQENVGTIIPGEQLPPGAQETVEHDQNTDAPDIEARARAMGWVSQDEFRGDPARWRPADEFVQRGENEMPLLRENLRRTTDQLTDLQSRLAKQEQEFKGTIQRIEKMSDTALKRQREQLDESWSAAMRNAAANGDIEQYQRLESGKAAAISSFDQQLSEVREPPKPQPQSPSQNPEYQTKVDTWAQRNPWFKTDPEMFHAATAYSNFVAQMTPNITLDDNLAQTEAYMKKRYADKFTAPSGGSAPVEGGGGRMSGTVGRGKGWNELPADAREQAKKFIKEGLFKDESDYAKDYWSQ